MKYFYHGTSTKNFLNIINDGILVTDYYGEKGIYITDDFMKAELFGEIVFCFREDILNKNNFHEDDVNDGIFYKNGIILSDFKIVTCLDNRLGRHEAEKLRFIWKSEYLIADCFKKTMSNPKPIKFEQLNKNT